MVKGDGKKRPRIVKLTNTWPPVTYSYFGEVPRRLTHHIEGNLEITYTPEWIEDLTTKVRYDISEDEDQVKLVDPGGLVGKPRKVQKLNKK